MTKFTVGIVGNLSFGSEDRLNPHKQLEAEGMHDFIAALAAQPMPSDRVRADYANLALYIDNLLEQGALRQEDGRIWLNFTVFTSDDQRIIGDVCRRDARDLAAAIDRRRDAIWAILGNYPEKAVTLPQLAYAAVGSLILDLSCLEWIADWGYAIAGKIQKNGDDYTLWANEQCDAMDLRAVYWGCHSEQAGPHTLMTFGDHAPTTIRRALPDEIWRARSRAAKGAPRPIAESADVWARQMFSDTATVLASLRTNRPDGLSAEARDSALAILREYGYIAEGADGRLHPVVPVLTAEDAAMFRDVSTIVKDIVRDHLANGFARLRDDLLAAGLTPLRHGVSFEEVYVQLWHYIFGFANQQLAASGFNFDPYADGRWPGYMPALFDLSLIK